MYSVAGQGANRSEQARARATYVPLESSSSSLHSGGIRVLLFDGFGNLTGHFDPVADLAAADRIIAWLVDNKCAGFSAVEVADKFYDPDLDAHIISFTGTGSSSDPIIYRMEEA